MLDAEILDEVPDSMQTQSHAATLVSTLSVASATWEQVEFSMLPRAPLGTGTRFCCPAVDDGAWNADLFRSLDNFVTCNHCIESVVILGAMDFSRHRSIGSTKEGLHHATFPADQGKP